MQLTVLGGCGAWPGAGQACSGYLLRAGDYLLLIDPGYATLPRLLETVEAQQVDAVLVSHGHPDHCADLNPLLRARALSSDPAPALPVYALPGALDAVLSLDRPGMLADAYSLHEFAAGDTFALGPFSVETSALPHFVPNAGMRIASGDATLVYTGDSGPSPEIVRLARTTNLLLAEATFIDAVPPDDTPYLSSARECGRRAAQAHAGALVLTHLWPGTDPALARAAAHNEFDGPVEVARTGLVIDL